MLKFFRIFSAVIFITYFLCSCQPVNYFTRLNKTPREYAVNYCDEAIKAPKSELNKQIWIVFSAQDDNYSYANPGGKVKFKQFTFLDAFLVLKKKGEYLQLIKYDPSVINNIYSTKLKDRKKVEYCGWIHKSKLLLTRQSTTDISTGFRNKQLVGITDASTLTDPTSYFLSDSITTFKDENLTKNHLNIPINSLVYVLKDSKNGENTLIAKRTTILPDSAKTEILGWVPSSLVAKIGQRLHVDLKTIPDTLMFFKDIDKIDTLAITERDLTDNFLLNKNIPPLKYNPVFSYKEKKTDTVSIRTAITAPIIDNQNNYVFNVNGNKIYYDKFQKLEKDSRKLNILFVLEGHKRVLESYSEIANVIQNLQPIFEKDSTTYKYQFGTILTSQGSSPESYPKIKASELTSNYTQLMDSLVVEIDSVQFKEPIPTRYAWSGIEKAVKILEPYKNENNILVVVGGSGYSEWADSTLVRKIGDLNIRMLGFQIHGVKTVEGNDFVLQMENMIETSANRISQAKKEKIVYPSQVKSQNLFLEVSKNVYRLDYPNYSMTQGWILFPEKEGELPLDILTSSVDSLVAEVKSDNDNIISSLYNAFGTVGKQRNLYGELFAQYNRIDDIKSLNKGFANKFSKLIPVGYLPSQKINLSDSINEQVKYQLLLSQDEMEDLLLFVSKLSDIEVDIKYKGEKAIKKKKYCNCEDDDDDEIGLSKRKQNTEEQKNNAQVQYRSTKTLRKKLRQTFVNGIKDSRFCKISKKELNNYTLGQAQQQMTGCPSFSVLLSSYKIDDIKNKKKISDKDLDTLVEYFKMKKDFLMKNLSSLDKFDSNGATYYWLDQRLLP